LARAQLRGQRLRDGVVRDEAEHGVHDLSQALGAKLAELAVDGHAPPHVNRRQRRISTALVLVFY
jgi:hypothetical protein